MAAIKVTVLARKTAGLVAAISQRCKICLVNGILCSIQIQIDFRSIVGVAQSADGLAADVRWEGNVRTHESSVICQSTKDCVYTSKSKILLKRKSIKEETMYMV